MYVYVIRHGESESNRDGLWTGWLDAPLTDHGRADAKRAGEFLANISFDRIVSSDLSRAKETAEIAVPGANYETSALLREIDVGRLAGKTNLALSDAQRLYAAQVERLQPHGEGERLQLKRLRAELAVQLQSVQKKQTVLAARHAHGHPVARLDHAEILIGPADAAQYVFHAKTRLPFVYSRNLLAMPNMMASEQASTMVVIIGLAMRAGSR